MSKPVSTVWKLSSLKTESVSRQRSLSGPSAWPISSLRQSRISCGAASDGMKTEMRSRRSSVVQSSCRLPRAARNSSHPPTRGTTKQAACGTAVRMVANGRKVTTMPAVPVSDWRAMSMPASARKRRSRRSRSTSAVGGTGPATASRTGPSKRVNRGSSRPLSSVKARSRKSRAISPFVRAGASARGGPKTRIAGMASAASGSVGARPAPGAAAQPDSAATSASAAAMPRQPAPVVLPPAPLLRAMIPVRLPLRP
jgi:hypothetical protein